MREISCGSSCDKQARAGNVFNIPEKAEKLHHIIHPSYFAFNNYRDRCKKIIFLKAEKIKSVLSVCEYMYS
jgi:hypothetical protein